MKQRIALVLGLLLLLGGSYFGLRLGQAEQVKGRGQAGVGSSAQPKVKVSFAKLPLAFEKNEGQVDSRVLFLARSRGGTVFVTEEGATFALAGDRPRAQDVRERRHEIPAAELGPRREGAAFKMKVVGSKVTAPALGVEKLPGIANYFIGNDRSKWHTDIPTFAKVKVPGIYPGIDLVYYGSNEGHLEYDFAVAPGANADVIRVAFEGVDRVRVNGEGDLILAVAGREVIQRRPRVYEEDGGRKRELGAAYVVRGNQEVAFRVDGRDRSRAMVIDPAIIYSTYLGGASDDQGKGIAVDGSGNAYVTGETYSTDFPTTAGAYQSADKSGWDAFVTKLSLDGGSLVYSTYLGGAGSDEGKGIAVDGSGNAYVTGSTDSTDFPMSIGAYQSAKKQGGDAFVTKLSPDGKELVYSTYLGGAGADEGDGIAVDGSGSAYVTGVTDSTDFPPKNPLPGSSGINDGTETDAFVTKLSPDGGSLVYSTYLGGAGKDMGVGIAVDGSGSAYVTGSTSSANFQTTVGAYQSMLKNTWDAFVTKLSPDGGALIYSTYLGGWGYHDFGQSIAVDSQFSAYVTGSTFSNDFPTTSGAYQSVRANSTDATAADAFVTKLSLDGKQLVYSTYLGGWGSDKGNGISVDNQFSAYVTGWTTSNDFPGATPRPTARTDPDAFVTKLSPDGKQLVYSNYVGGSGQDFGTGIAVVADVSSSLVNAYVIGYTMSTDFPTTIGRSASRGSNDVFIAKIASPMALTLTSVSPPSGPPAGGTTVTLTGSSFPAGATVTLGGVQANPVTVSRTTEITATTPPHAAGSVDVAVMDPNDLSQTSTLHNAFTYINPPTITNISPNSGPGIGGTKVTITGTDFVTGAKVTIGSREAEDVSVVNGTTITATAPSHSAGSVDVVVTNPDGQMATLAGAYAYDPVGKHGCGCGGSGSGPALLLGLVGLYLVRARRRVTT